MRRAYHELDVVAVHVCESGFHHRHKAGKVNVVVTTSRVHDENPHCDRYLPTHTLSGNVASNKARERYLACSPSQPQMVNATVRKS